MPTVRIERSSFHSFVLRLMEFFLLMIDLSLKHYNMYNQSMLDANSHLLLLKSVYIDWVIIIIWTYRKTGETIWININRFQYFSVAFGYSVFIAIKEFEWQLAYVALELRMWFWIFNVCLFNCMTHFWMEEFLSSINLMHAQYSQSPNSSINIEVTDLTFRYYEKGRQHFNASRNLKPSQVLMFCILQG